jgi:hypothetical protein
MVSVVVGLENVLDDDTEEARDFEVLIDLEPRVHDRRDTGPVIADEIRGAAEVIVEYLSEQQI